MEFKKMDEIQKRILMEVADLHSVPEGAFNIRSDGQLAGRANSANIEITSKENGKGIDIRIKDGTKNESVHIPVILSKSGLHVGENCDVIIVAGCGISNCGGMDSEHDGIHRFFVGRNSKVRYVEKHYGEGDGTGKRILNPVTEVYMQEGSNVEMEMVQIKGVDSTDRRTIAKVAENASLVVKERLMTHGEQFAASAYTVDLDGDGSSADIVSRSVARDKSYQKLDLRVNGNAACSGHTECDSIIMDEGRILAVPQLEANCTDSALIHEAAIGKIAGDQLIKLMTLGLTEKEAEEQIVNGFLK